MAIDIDGTLGDYHGHFSRFISGYLGRQVKHGEEYPYTKEFSEWLGVPKDEYRAAKLAYRQGGMKRTMPVFKNSSCAVATLRNSGVEVWLATTRPWLRLDNIDPDTRAWLDRHAIQYDHIIYGEDKYDQLAQLVDPDRVLAIYDDLPEQIDHATELGFAAYQKHNNHRGTGARIGFQYIGEFVKRVDVLHGRWRNQNG